MTVKINIHYPVLQQYANNQEVVEVNGSTVGDCLKDFAKKYPDAEKMLFDEHGKLRNYIMVFVNQEYASPVELAKP